MTCRRLKPGSALPKRGVVEFSGRLVKGNIIRAGSGCLNRNSASRSGDSAHALIASSTCWPPRAGPRITSSEIEVALRSSRTERRARRGSAHDPFWPMSELFRRSNHFSPSATSGPRCPCRLSPNNAARRATHPPCIGCRRVLAISVGGRSVRAPGRPQRLALRSTAVLPAVFSRARGTAISTGPERARQRPRPPAAWRWPATPCCSSLPAIWLARKARSDSTASS